MGNQDLPREWEQEYSEVTLIHGKDALKSTNTNELGRFDLLQIGEVGPTWLPQEGNLKDDCQISTPTRPNKNPHIKHSRSISLTQFFTEMADTMEFGFHLPPVSSWKLQIHSMALGGLDKTRQLQWFDDDRGSISKLLLCANDIAANDCFTSLAHSESG